MFSGRRMLDDLGYKESIPLELEDGEIQFSEVALKDGMPFVAIGRSKASARSTIALARLPAAVQYAWIEGKERALYRRTDGSSFSRCATLPTAGGVMWGRHARQDLLPLHSIKSAIEYAQGLLPVPNDEALALLLGIKLLDEASGGELRFRLTEAEQDQAAPLAAGLARAFDLEAEWSSAPTLPAEALGQIVLAWQAHRLLSALAAEGVFCTLAALISSNNRGGFLVSASVVRLIQHLLAGTPGPLGIAGAGAASWLDIALSTGAKVSLIGNRHHRLLMHVAHALLPGLHSVSDGLLDLGEGLSWPVIVCQPPFGRIIDSILLERSEMASDWRGRRAGTMGAEALWLEKCHGLLSEGGLLMAVLPDGFLSNPSAQPARRWLMERFELRAVFSLPVSAFRPAAAIKCSLVCLQKAERPREQYRVFMSELEEADLEDSAEIVRSYRQATGAEGSA